MVSSWDGAWESPWSCRPTSCSGGCLDCSDAGGKAGLPNCGSAMSHPKCVAIPSSGGLQTSGQRVAEVVVQREYMIHAGDLDRPDHRPVVIHHYPESLVARLRGCLGGGFQQRPQAW